MANSINESQLANASKTELIGYVLDTINQTQSDSCKKKCGSDDCSGGCDGCGD